MKRMLKSALVVLVALSMLSIASSPAFAAGFENVVVLTEGQLEKFKTEYVVKGPFGSISTSTTYSDVDNYDEAVEGLQKRAWKDGYNLLAIQHVSEIVPVKIGRGIGSKSEYTVVGTLYSFKEKPEVTVLEKAEFDDFRKEHEVSGPFSTLTGEDTITLESVIEQTSSKGYNLAIIESREPLTARMYSFVTEEERDKISSLEQKIAGLQKTNSEKIVELQKTISELRKFKSDYLAQQQREKEQREKRFVNVVNSMDFEAFKREYEIEGPFGEVGASIDEYWSYSKNFIRALRSVVSETRSHNCNLVVIKASKRGRDRADIVGELYVMKNIVPPEREEVKQVTCVKKERFNEFKEQHNINGPFGIITYYGGESGARAKPSDNSYEVNRASALSNLMERARNKGFNFLVTEEIRDKINCIGLIGRLYNLEN